jgi:hypothetical protein
MPSNLHRRSRDRETALLHEQGDLRSPLVRRLREYAKNTERGRMEGLAVENVTKIMCNSLGTHRNGQARSQ